MRKFAYALIAAFAAFAITISPVFADGGWGGWGKGGWARWGAGPGFQPSDISGLILWLDASDASTITEVAGEVELWADKSTESNDLVQATPPRKPDNGGTLNGRVALNFDGDDRLDNTTLSSDSTITIFVTFRASATQENMRLVQIINAGETQSHSINSENTWANIHYRRAGAIDNNANSWSGGDFTVTTGVTYMMMGQSATNTSHTARLSSQGEKTSTLDTGDTTTTECIIGNYRASITEGMIGLIGEILVYDSAISSGDISSVESYLTSKWGAIAP